MEEIERMFESRVEKMPHKVLAHLGHRVDLDITECSRQYLIQE